MGSSILIPIKVPVFINVAYKGQTYWSIKKILRNKFKQGDKKTLVHWKLQNAAEIN